MTTALYRRYRPETFGDVIGQEHVTEPLMRALQTGRVGHAYLFSGPRGCGKTTSARILARCLNCDSGPTPVPCGTCDSCVAMARGGPGSVDVIEIDAASHGGVDDARDLRERASYGPALSRFKVYIIDEAHMVTTQGFNALLKIVEEPPEHVKFVFATTEPEKVIGTIRSRTHHYPFRLVPPAKLTDYLEQLCRLEGVSVAPGVLGFVIRAGGGSVRDSLSVLDQLIAGSGDDGLTYDAAAALLGFTGVELLDATIDALAARDSAAVFTVVDKVVESGHDPRRFAMDLLERLRDLIIIAAVPDGAAQVLRGVPEDQLDRMRGQQSRFGPGALSRAADIVNAGITEMTGATSPRLHLELICARILLPGATGEQGYAARLDRLERRLDASTPPPVHPAAPPQRAEDARAAGAGSSRNEVASSVPAGQGTPSGKAARDNASGAGEAQAAGEVRPSRASQAQVAASAAGEGRSAGEAQAASGVMDLAAVRRVWPDVLGRIFSVRRVTWTFLSQHAQVIEYDGSRLVLGIATTGLANTFRQGNHAEVVRQALLDAVGIDVHVEGIPLPPDTPPLAEPTPPAASRSADSGARPAEASTATGRANAGPRTGPTEAEPATGLTEADLATAPAEIATSQPAPTNVDGDNGLTGAASARRGASVRPTERTARHTENEPDTDPDELASVDDEDVDADAESGQAVIERMLGGRVVGETTD